MKLSRKNVSSSFQPGPTVLTVGPYSELLADSDCSHIYVLSRRDLVLKEEDNAGHPVTIAPQES